MKSTILFSSLLASAVLAAPSNGFPDLQPLTEYRNLAKPRSECHSKASTILDPIYETKAWEQFVAADYFTEGEKVTCSFLNALKDEAKVFEVADKIFEVLETDCGKDPNVLGDTSTFLFILSVASNQVTENLKDCLSLRSDMNQKAMDLELRLNRQCTVLPGMEECMKLGNPRDLYSPEGTDYTSYYEYYAKTDNACVIADQFNKTGLPDALDCATEIAGWERCVFTPDFGQYTVFLKYLDEDSKHAECETNFKKFNEYAKLVDVRGRLEYFYDENDPCSKAQASCFELRKDVIFATNTEFRCPYNNQEFSETEKAVMKCYFSDDTAAACKEDEKYKNSAESYSKKCELFQACSKEDCAPFNEYLDTLADTTSAANSVIIGSTSILAAVTGFALN